MIAIVSVSESWGIGRDNDLLFKIPEDMRRFKEITMGGVVVMGRRTFESLPGRRALPGRRNLILSQDPAFATPEGTERARDGAALLELVKGEDPDRVFVIGGESVYRLLLSCCSRAYITKVRADPPADRIFPNLDRLPEWRVEREEPPREHDGLRFRYIDYRRME